MSATPNNRSRALIGGALITAVLAAVIFILGWRGLIGALPFMSEARVELVGSAFRPMLVAAILYSIPLAIVSFIIGLVIALVVALVRVVPATGVAHRLLLAFVHGYVSAIRGTPMLVQLMIVFYGLPAIGITLEPMPTAIIGSDKLQPIGTSIPKKGKTKGLYGKPIEVAKKPADEITHDDLRSLTDRVSAAIQKMSGQEFVNEYAQKVKAELKAQQAAEETE